MKTVNVDVPTILQHAVVLILDSHPLLLRTRKFSWSKKGVPKGKMGEFGGVDVVQIV